jgi:hypothetical protein
VPIGNQQHCVIAVPMAVFTRGLEHLLDFIRRQEFARAEF